MKQFYKTTKHFIYNRQNINSIPPWNYWEHAKTRTYVGQVITPTCDYKIRILFANLLKK